MSTPTQSSTPLNNTVPPQQQSQYMTVDSQSSKKVQMLVVISIFLIMGAVGAFVFMYSQTSSNAFTPYRYSLEKKAAQTQSNASPTSLPLPTATKAPIAEEASDPESLVVDDLSSDFETLSTDLGGL